VPDERERGGKEEGGKKKFFDCVWVQAVLEHVLSLHERFDEK